MEKVISFLGSNGIEYVLHEHPAVFTCEEAETHCGHIPGKASKNLLLKTKAGRYFLVILPAEKRLDLKKFMGMVNESKVSFASPKSLKEILNLEPGSVSPFGLLNDEEIKAEFYIDRDMYEAQTVSFHPNVNTATLELSREMFQNFLDKVGHEIKVIDL